MNWFKVLFQSTFYVITACGHKFCIYVVNCSHKLVQHSFSKHLLENTCDHKLCSFMVDDCHELIQYVFSKNLLDNNCDHKLCIIWYIVLINTVSIHFFKVSGHKLCIYMVYSHELFEYVFEKHLLEIA